MRQVKTNNTTVEEIKKPRPIDIILSILQRTCVFFTVFTLVVLIVSFAVESSNYAPPDPARFLMLFPFALCITLVNLIFKARAVKMFWKLVIHFFVITESFILFFQSGVTAKAHISILLIFLVVYIIIAAPILIVLGKKNKKLEKEEKYVPMFSKSNASKK